MRMATMMVAGMLVAIALPLQAEDKKDTSKLIGTWTVTAEEKDGKQAGELGFEPRRTDPESVVLPLHYSPGGRWNDFAPSGRAATEIHFIGGLFC